MSLFSIGYATKDIDLFIDQLKEHGVQVVADVRSVPYSNAFFDYHQEALIRHLKQAGLRYVYLGTELGPRSKDPSHYDNSQQVQFDRLIESALFQKGMSRLKTGLDKGYSIALTCAEKEPAVCHRSLLIAYAVQRQLNVNTRHILHDGDIEFQSVLEERLGELTNTYPDMLTTPEEVKALAYERQCKCCAYRRPISD